MTVSEQIIQVLDNLGEKFGLAIDWSSENILPYVNELMNKAVSYELWMNIVPLVFVGVGMIIFWTVFFKTIKNKDFDWDEDEVGLITVISLIMAAMFSVAFIICLIFCTSAIIACLTFPEKVIFDMIKSML